MAYEVFFKVLAFFVLFPIIAWAEKLWLVGNKTNVTAWYNVGSFIRNPVSWLVLLFMAAVLVWGTMVEQFSLYDTLHALSPASIINATIIIAVIFSYKKPPRNEIAH